MTDWTLPAPTMTDQQLKRNLQTAGMACFVKYFDALTNPALPNPEVVKIVQQHESYADQSCPQPSFRRKPESTAGMAGMSCIVT